MIVRVELAFVAKIVAFMNTIIIIKESCSNAIIEVEGVVAIIARIIEVVAMVV